MGALDVALDLPSAKRQKVEEVATVSIHVGGKVEKHPLGTAVKEILNDGSVAARLDNLVVPISRPIIGSDVHLEGIPFASPDGIRSLVESLKLMLKVAKHRCSPELALIIGKPIGGSYFCMLTDKAGNPHMPSEEQLAKYLAAMHGLIDAATALRYKTVSRENALAVMSKTGLGFTSKMIAESNVAQFEVVDCEGIYHLPRAPVFDSCDLVPKESFNLVLYKDGFLLEHFRCDTKSGQAKHLRYGNTESDLLYNEYKARLQWASDVELQSIAQLNSAIRDGRSKQVIQAVEANCDRQFVEIAAQIKAGKNVRLVLIAGPSSSGKTTFAKRLQVQLEALGSKPVVLSVDGFYKAWQDITSEGPQKVDWEALDSLNLEQLNDVLLTLMSGKQALIPEYDMKSSMPMSKEHWTTMQLHTNGKGIIIMEGIHCLNPALTKAVPKDQKFNIAIAPIPALQLDASHVLSGTTIRLLRRMVRDYLFRGRPVLTTLRQWSSVVAGEFANIYPHQGNADAVMNSEIAFEMCVLKVHVEPLLRTVRSTEKEYSEVCRLLQTLDQFIALPTNIIPPQSLLREFIGGSWYYDYGGWYKSH